MFSLISLCLVVRAPPHPVSFQHTEKGALSHGAIFYAFSFGHFRWRISTSRFKRSISFGSQFLYNLPLLFNGRIFLYLVALLLLPCNRISMCWLLAYLRCTSCIKTINLHGDLRHLHIYLLIMAVDVFGSKIGNQNIVRNYINRIAQFNASIWMVRPNYPFHRTGCACEWMFFSWSTIVSHL